MFASQHIRLYGTTIDGATLCPGSSRANTTSFALHGLLGPQIAVCVCVCVCVCGVVPFLPGLPVEPVWATLASSGRVAYPIIAGPRCRPGV